MILDEAVLQLPSFGRVSILVAGDLDGPLVIALRGSGHKDTQPCWEDAAGFLTDRGFRVVLPDLHSNAATTPAALSPAAAAQVVAQTADALLADEFHLMGKSWGGIVAFNTARAWPQRVRRLVLATPPITDGGTIRSLPGACPVLLLWAERDAVMPFRLAQQFIDCLGARVQLLAARGGGGNGGTINPEWLQPIYSFLAT